MICTHSHLFKLLSDVRIYSNIEENMSLEYCMHSSVLAYVCFQHASCLLYIGMKQVIYSVHSCMVSLVYIWLCSPQASNNNNNNNYLLNYLFNYLLNYLLNY